LCRRPRVQRPHPRHKGLQKLTLGGDVTLETFNPNFQNAECAPVGDKALSHRLTNLDNMGWKEVDFPVPNAPVAHRPVYHIEPTEYARVQHTPRQQRLSPTADSALLLGEETVREQAVEAFMDTPIHIAWDVIRMPFLMIGYPGFNHVKNSPTGSYERKPLHDTQPPGTSIAPGSASERLDTPACSGCSVEKSCTCPASGCKGCAEGH
jgi:hypothetical protein